MPRSLATTAPMALLGLALATGCGDQVVGSFDPTQSASTGSSTASGGSGSMSGSTGGSIADSTTSSAGSTLDDSGDGPLGPEQCNGLDDDGDGLVDEVAPELAACDDCRLLQGVGQAWWICEQQLTWFEAQARCQSLGATVAIVPDVVTQVFLHEQVGTGFHWLGAKEIDGAWTWVDGTPWRYTNWGTTQPDDLPPGQDCLRLTFGIVDAGWFDGAWDDFYCENLHPVTCSAPHAAP